MAGSFADFVNGSDNFTKVVSIESNDNQFDRSGKPLTSSAGAIGAAQVMPNTAPEAADLAGVPFDENRFRTDKEYNKKLGKAYFDKQVEDFGDEAKAAAAYNAGPKAVRKAIEKYGDNWLQGLPKETQDYVAKYDNSKPKESFADFVKTKPTTSFAEFAGNKKPTQESKPGSFLDYVFGDKVSDKGLSDLIVNKPERQQSSLETGASHFVAGIPAAMGGFGTAALLEGAGEAIGVAAAPFTGGASLVVAPILTGLLGYGVGSYAAGKAEHALLPDKVNKYLDEGAKQNEYSAFAGDLAAYAPVGGVSTPQTLKKAAVLAAGGLGFEGVNQAIEGKFDPTKLAISAVTMPFLGGKPTKLGDIASFKSLREKTSTESAADLAAGPKEVYVPTKLGDTKVVDISKETPESYTQRHDIPLEEHIEHQGERYQNLGSIRSHTDKEGNTVIEVEPRNLEQELKSGRAEEDVGLPKGTFKSPQDYLDFMIHREKISHETTYEDWKAANPDFNVSDVYNSRKAYYDELGELRSNAATKMLSREDASGEISRIKDLEEQGAPTPVVKDAAKPTSEEMRSILYGSKNVGEALDRLVAGNFGGERSQTLFKILQKSGYVSNATLNLHDIEHPKNPKIYGEYFGGAHHIDMYYKSGLSLFAHEALHAATSNALTHPKNAAIRDKLESILSALKDGASKDEHWNDTTNTGIYGLKNIDELISEAFSNRGFQEWLSNRSVIVDNKTKSGWDHFKDAVKDVLGIKKTDGISALDQVMDLAHEVTHQDNQKFSKWDRKSTIDKFDYTQGSYMDYLNKSALEQAQTNPFFNIDSLNIPDAPNDANGLANYLFTLDHGKAQDDIIASHIYDEAKFTPEQNERIRLFVEGLNERHVALHNEANDLDKLNRVIQKEISERYNTWKLDNPYAELKDAPPALKRFAAERYQRIEANKLRAQEARDLAKEPTTLSPEDKVLYDTYVKPILESRKTGLQYLMDEGILPKQELKGDNFPRKLSPMSKAKQEQLNEVLRAKGLAEPEPSFLGKAKNYIQELAGGDMGGFNADMQRRRGATEDRSLFVLETKGGRRDVIQVTKSGNIIKWDNKEPSLLTRKVNPDGSMVTESGNIKVGDDLLGGKVVEGTMQEIEYHSPYEYNKDSLAVLLNANSEIREQVRVYEGIKRLVEGEMFKKDAIKVVPGVAIPEGMRLPERLDKIPALVGYAFPNKTAEVIEDFARIREPSMLTNLSNILIKNMMLNPLPHIFNEAMHLYNARGLTGWVSPAGVARFAKYTKQSIDSVLTQDEFFRDTMKYGGSLLSPGVRNSEFQNALFNKGVQEFSKTPELKELALAVGRAPGELLNGISKQSNKGMWIARDIMYIQYLKELMATKGLTHIEAIQQAERHLPNYRLPTRIGDKVLGAQFGRGLSATLQNPNIAVFSRYHYGMLKSMIETARDVTAIRKGKAGVEEFKDGIDSVAATVVALSVLYPLMDYYAQHLTGEKDSKLSLGATGLETSGTARQRRAGPYHLFNAISEVADGSKDPQAVLSSIFTFNPVLQGLAELGFDRKLYSGQQIYNPQSAPDVVAKDIASYILKMDPLMNQAITAQSDKGGAEEGWATIAAKQADIQAPSDMKAILKEKQIAKLQKKGIVHTVKSRLGLE